LKPPFSADPTTGTNILDQHTHAAEPSDDKFIPREPYGVERLHLAGNKEQEIQILCQRVMAALDGSASGEISFSEICRTSAKPPWKDAVNRLIETGVIEKSFDAAGPRGSCIGDRYRRKHRRKKR
jgi:hypothetical protein